MSSFSIGRSARAGENRLLLHLGAPGGMERGLATRRYATKEISMFQTSKFILPYEPGYTGHWEAEKRRKETREWLRQREREIAAPSIVPEMPERDATLTPKHG
jgi:hypothetical protein